MESIPADGLTLYYDPQDQKAAILLQQACQLSVKLIHEYWGLQTPKDCRVYLMTSWSRFMFHAAPWGWRLVLALSLPLWAFYARRLWRYAGGWVQGFGKRRAVGIKHPVLIHGGDPTLGERFFVREHNLDKKFQQIICHELTHAFTWHLKLPHWLNEGLAMLTVDHYSGKATVRCETLEFLSTPPTLSQARRGNRVNPDASETLAYQYVRGYWLTRYFEEVNPGLLKRLLATHSAGQDIEREIAMAVDKEPIIYWGGIDEIVASYYRRGLKTLTTEIMP